MNTDLILKEITNKEESYILRNIRNECKNFMTRSTEYITIEQQDLWYSNLDRTKNLPYLLYSIDMGVIFSPIGYGFIREENGSILLSGGLIESERGKGYGSCLFNILLKQALKKKLPIKLEVLKTNNKAFSIYNGLGFRVVEDDGKVIKMEYFYDSVI